MGNEGADVAGKKRSWKRRKEEPWLLFGDKRAAGGPRAERQTLCSGAR